MNNQPAIMKSQSDNWGTPIYLFKYLEDQFGKFDLDAAAESNWHMVSEYLTKEDNALDPLVEWKGNNVYINPPYDQKTISLFIDRAIKEHIVNGKNVTLLLPAKTDQDWFKKCLVNNALVMFITGRLSFREKDGNKKQNATFPSVIIHFGRDIGVMFQSNNELKNKYKDD
jgi:phage N-6-adenine-methyltransferase